MKRRVHLSGSLTAEQVAQVLACEVETVYRLAARGALRGWRLGQRWRFTPEAVQTYIKSREHHAVHHEPIVRERPRPLLELPGSDRYIS